MTAILQPAEIIKPGRVPPQVIVPNRAAVFADRARRFDALATGHSLGDWLRLMGKLSRAQHDALQAFPALNLPAASQSLAHGMPPLLAHSWPRLEIWRDVLMTLIDACIAEVPPAGAAALRALRTAPAQQLESLADRVLRTELYGDTTALPWVAAALQVYWTHMAITLGAKGIPPIDAPGVCPCCGFLPVASVVRIDGEVSGLRYLHCALCNTEWNCVRVKCTSCDANDAVAYRQIAGSGTGSPAVRAETCDTCKSYLKILYLDKAPDGDPVADDLATLTLDMLVDEAGYARAGPNLLFVPDAS